MILPLGLYSVISVVIQSIFENIHGNLLYSLIGMLVKIVLASTNDVSFQSLWQALFQQFLV